MSATCFLIGPTAHRRVWLRRVHLGSHVHECSVHGYHDARALVGDFDLDGELPPPDEFRADRWPPLVVVCPNGQEWCPDRPSTNGTGWTVTGEAPRITCAPSIVVPGYHGFLRDGVFTADIEGRGPNGAPA